MSFYDPIRPRQHVRWNRESDLLSGSEVDDEFELRRLFHGEIGWHSAFENLVHIRGGAPVQSVDVHAVGDEPPASIIPGIPYITGSRLFTASSTISVR
jgi:hypothetical protein